MSKYIKLGGKASSFSCPTTGLSIVPGKVFEMTPEVRASKSVQQALKGGHLVYADSKDVKEAAKTGDNENSMDPEFLSQKSKSTLVEMALKICEEREDGEITPKEINKMNKEALVEYITTPDEDDSDDEDDDEDEDEK